MLFIFLKQNKKEAKISKKVDCDPHTENIDIVRMFLDNKWSVSEVGFIRVLCPMPVGQLFGVLSSFVLND